ncbi:MAG: hypothetical protein ABJP48_03655 [Erythrobacter sp.]
MNFAKRGAGPGVGTGTALASVLALALGAMALGAMAGPAWAQESDGSDAAMDAATKPAEEAKAQLVEEETEAQVAEQATAQATAQATVQATVQTEPVEEEDFAAILSSMLSLQSQTQGDELEAVLEQASAFPLGSAENPVRAAGPPGQRAYLARLRCSDLSRTQFYRAGSAGMSPYGNIVDIYIVSCASGTPENSEIYIDMYHSGHVEEAAVPGYGITGGRAAE